MAVGCLCRAASTCVVHTPGPISPPHTPHPPDFLAIELHDLGFQVELANLVAPQIVRTPTDVCAAASDLCVRMVG